MFVSYAREDAGIVTNIRNKLIRKGLTTWTDTGDIKKGEKFEDAIYKGLIEADTFVYFISPDSVASEYCLKELEWVRHYNKRVVPVLIRETPTDQIPPDVSQFSLLNLLIAKQKKQVAEKNQILKKILMFYSK